MTPALRPRIVAAPRPITERITGALFLAPMTVPELARCLTRSHDCVRFGLYRLRDAGMVEVCGRRQAQRGQWRDVYRLRWWVKTLST